MLFHFHSFSNGSGFFECDDVLQAILSAWNIEDSISLVDGWELLFDPYEDDDFNDDCLKEHGYKLGEANGRRTLIYLKTMKPIDEEKIDLIKLI